MRGSRFSRLEPLDGDRDNANENNADGDQEEILLDHFPSPQPVSGDKEEGNPNDSTEDVVQPEFQEVHFADPRYERCEGSNDGDEPGKDDGFGAVTLVERLRAEEMIPIEPSRSVAPENPRAKLVACPIVNRISHDCCDGQQGNHDPELQGAIGDGAQRTHREQEGVSGQERKDHQACFAENDRKEDHVQPLSPDRLHQFAEVAVHMKDPFEELAHGFSWLFRAS